MGQQAAYQSGVFAQGGANTMGTSAAQAGATRAGGTQGSYNAWANAANDIGGLDWGGMFKKKPSSYTGP